MGLRVPLFHGNVILIILVIMLLIISSLTRADVNVRFPLQDFNVRGVSWFSSVNWGCDFFGPIEFRPAGRNINSGRYFSTPRSATIGLEFS